MNEKSDVQSASSHHSGLGRVHESGPIPSDGPVTVVNPERSGNLRPNQLPGNRADSALLNRLFPLNSPQDPDALSESLSDITLGHFRIEERIGSGGMGAVFRAFDERLERVVALKVLAPGQSHDHDAVQRFLNEARAAARLDHDNIARVHYNGEDRGLHYIAFEYVTGTNLREMIRQKGPLEPAEAVNYALQIASALKHTSAAGVVHRDIKPSNIIVTPAGRAKLVDLGLARKDYSESANELTLAGTTLGTFDYISPEQAKDPRHVDVRSDIYSLGCTLYHMLTGQPPYPDGTFFKRLLDHQDKEPPNPAELAPKVSPALAAVVQKMMASDPRDRYATADDLIRDFMLIAGHMGLRGINPEGLIWATSQAKKQSFWQQHLGWMVSVAALLLVVLFLEGFPGIGEQSVDGESVSQPQFHQKATNQNGLENGSQLSGLLSGSSDQNRTSSKSSQTGSNSSENKNKNFNPRPLAVGHLLQEELNNALIAAVGSGNPLNFSSTHHPALVRPDSPKSVTGSTNTQGSGTSNSSPQLTGPTSTKSPPVVATLRPITVLSKVRSESRSFPTLEGACSWAESSDVIVLSFNGTRKGLDGKPVLDTPILINKKKNITIRAANGFRPRIEFVAQPLLSAGYQTQMITVSGGSSLDLFNVDLSFQVNDSLTLEDNQLWSLFLLHNSDRVKLEGVKITISNPSGKPATVAEFRPATGPAKMKTNMMKTGMASRETDERFEFQLRNSFIRGNCEAFHLGMSRPGRIEIQQSALALDQSLLTITGPEIGDMPPKNTAIEVKLEHDTCLLGGELIRMDSGDQPRELLPISVTADNNIFASKGSQPLIYMTGNTESRDFRTVLLRWSGSNNFYDQFKTLWTIDSSSISAIPEKIDFTTWKSQWSESEVSPYSGGVAWARSWREIPFDKLALNDMKLDPQADREKFPAIAAANNGSAVGADLDKLRQIFLASPSSENSSTSP
ncbi:MAG: hypothetical protein Tsb009_05980 [Planctomycetaceae bacterium]